MIQNSKSCQSKNLLYPRIPLCQGSKRGQILSFSQCKFFVFFRFKMAEGGAQMPKVDFKKDLPKLTEAQLNYMKIIENQVIFKIIYVFFLTQNTVE